MELFSIKAVCQVTGFSRSNLMILEKNGLVTPAEVNEDTGYRYYSLKELLQILQYKNLRSMGLGQKEIADYFADRADLGEFIASLRIKQQLLTRSIEELELRYSAKKHQTFSYITMPETTCYCGTGQFVRPQEVALFTNRMMEEVMEKGYRVLAGEPLFGIRDDTRTTPIGNEKKPYTAKSCIPLDPESLPNDGDPHIEVIPAATLFSMLHYGGFADEDHFNASFERFWQEFDARGLKPTGPLRSIGVVCSKVGEDFDPGSFIFRFGVPIDPGTCGE